jgi:hypothetical protein
MCHTIYILNYLLYNIYVTCEAIMSKVFSPKNVVAAGLLVAAISIATAANAPSVHATSNHTACVDGSKRSNLSVTWNANDSISFKTVNNKPLCNDVTLYFSSYTMPDTYNGKGFSNNPTASPQTVFDSASYVMAKGTTGAAKLEINLPEACKNIQVDLYYAPEITTVTSKGHGDQYITGKIIDKTADSCTPVTPDEPEPPVTPEVPVPEAQTPETPPAQVTVPAPVPAELPKTGSAVALPIAISGIVAGITYATALFIKRQ